jgi:hypothetical protein
MRRALPLEMPTCLLILLLFTACGEEGAKGDASDPVPRAETVEGAPDASSQPGDPLSAPVTVKDIERWERGIAAELGAVQASGAKLEQARSSDDTLSALMGVQEMTTMPVGARAAGLDPERYNVVRSNLGAAVAYLTPHLGGIDTTMLSPAQREEMRQMNAAQLKQLEGAVPPEVIEALKPKAEALRKKELELTGARLKGAGM